MNASEKEITGVEDMHGLGSLRDALFAQAKSLAEMSGREAERERARNEARQQDNHWRGRMEDKTDRLFTVTDAMKATIAEIPAVIDRQVAQALAHHVSQTDGNKRSLTAVYVVVGILMALAIAATLEFVDREHIASMLLLIIMPVVSLGGWYVSSRKH